MQNNFEQNFDKFVLAVGHIGVAVSNRIGSRGCAALAVAGFAAAAIQANASPEITAPAGRLNETVSASAPVVASAATMRPRMKNVVQFPTPTP